jgi:AraC-like DNA-binding protein
MLTVETAPPEPLLRPYIRAYVQREAKLGEEELTEPVVARLGVMLEFEFAGSYLVPHYGSDLLDDAFPISVIGPHTWRRVRLIIRGHIESLVVLFQPCGFHALFRTPTLQLTGTGTEGHALLGSTVSQLHQRLGNLRSFAERASLLDSFFLNRLKRSDGYDGVQRAFELLTAPGSQASVAAVANQMGVHLRQLERKSLAYTGVSPKDLTRIARFSHALRLRSETSQTWTEIAYAAGYYDQMHMIRDFRVFAGEAPTLALEEIAADHLIHFCT